MCGREKHPLAIRLINNKKIMLNLSFNMTKTTKGFDVAVTADENGKVIHEEKLESITGKSMLSVRKKTLNLGGKSLTFSLNVIGKPKKKEK